MFRPFQRVYRASRWTRRHFTFLGHNLLVLMLAAGAFGVDTKSTNAYQLFSLLVVLFTAALAGGMLLRLRVRVERVLPQYFTVGEPAGYRISLFNEGPKPVNDLALIDELKETMPTREELEYFYDLQAKPRLRRIISFRMWLRYLHHRRGGFIQENPIDELKPGMRVNLEQSFVPTRRGVIFFRGTSIARADMLGLYRRLFFFRHEQRCLVLPRRYPMAPIDLPGKRKYQSGGVTLAGSVGDSSEFISLRDYRKGDALNSIHWKSFARHGKLIVREYQDEFFVRRGLVLDTFTDGIGNELFEAAVSVAASVCLQERSNDALLDLMFVGLDTYCFTTGRGVDHMPHVQEVLASIAPVPAAGFDRLHRAVENHLPHCSSMVCVLLQWDQARRDMVRMLEMNAAPVMVLLLHDGSLSREALPQPPQRLRLIDCHHLQRDLAAT